MLYIAENIRTLRKGKGYTQEEVADLLGVSPQSVSKWERGDTYPDITLLPAIANMFKTSIDSLVGMDKINDTAASSAVYQAAHDFLRVGDLAGAIHCLQNVRKTFPNDISLLSEHALVLALFGDAEPLNHAVSLCEQVLVGNPSEKVRHTIRAALSLIYLKQGNHEMARTSAMNLPHVRESREMILAQIQEGMTQQEIDAYLRLIILGTEDDQDIICIDFGIGMLSIVTAHHLLDKIREIRDEAGTHLLPKVRVRDNSDLAPNQVRVRHYADYLICKEFDNPETATEEVLHCLQTIIQTDLQNIH